MICHIFDANIYLGYEYVLKRKKYNTCTQSTTNRSCYQNESESEIGKAGYMCYNYVFHLERLKKLKIHKYYY